MSDLELHYNAVLLFVTPLRFSATVGIAADADGSVTRDFEYFKLKRSFQILGNIINMKTMMSFLFHFLRKTGFLAKRPRL